MAFHFLHSAPGWAAVASATIAFFALCVAFSANRTAKRALSLQESKREREMVPLQAHLIDALFTMNGGGREFEVSLLLINPSEIPNTVVRAELMLEHVVGGSVLAALLLPASVFPGDSSDANNSIILPASISPRGASSGFFRFSEPPGAVKPVTVRRYELHLTDSQHRVLVIPITSFKIKTHADGIS